MKVITTRTHGVLDYFVGALLILAPFLFGFNTGGPEQWVPVTLGAGAILYSLLTNYELGLFKLIPFRVHLTLDMLSGMFLAASPGSWATPTRCGFRTSWSVSSRSAHRS